MSNIAEKEHSICGCGHDHIHEHEVCGCGHDHIHEHEVCGCGHDHAHEDNAGCENKDSFKNTDYKNMQTFILENLGCANCAAKMERKINELSQVENATITFATKKLRLNADCNTAVLEEIQHICSDIEPAVRVVPAEKKKTEKTEEKSELPEILVGAAIFAGAEIYYKLSGVENYSVPIIALLVAAYIVLGREVLITAVKNLLKGNAFDENFLMGIATIGAFAIGEYPEAVGVMLFFRVGELFEDIAVEKSRSHIMEAVDLRPEVVNRIKDGEITVVPAEDAQKGDILLVRAGDRIPLDGVVVEGESRIDTSAVTGESIPVRAEKGSQVISGCVNTTGTLKIRVEKILRESMVTRILDSVENAAAGKPKIDSFITRFARVYTPIVVVLSIIVAFVVPFVTGQDYYKWIYTALTFLVMSCPCALVLSVPLAFFCGIGNGSKKGILFKGGIALEAIEKIKAVVMDKTGTVTKGNFEVQKIISAENIDENYVLEIAALCEKNSTHPIAASIVKEADNRGIKTGTAANIREISGGGISAEFEGKKIVCGNDFLMQSENIELPKNDVDNTGTQVFVACDGKFAGKIIIADTIKPETPEAIRNIKNKGIATAMLTGDTVKSAEEIAQKAGIENVYAKLLPQDKVEKLKDMREKYGEVMFVGDGINDAPVLAGADVGAAMGSGADAAIEAADVVFMNNNLDAVGQAIDIAKRTVAVSKQNVTFAIAVKAIVLVLGITGIYSNMWLAVFADTGVAFLCILNSVRLLVEKR